MSEPELNIMDEFSRLLRHGPEPAPGGEQGGWRAVYRLEPDFVGFAGHFPGYPLMPALMQVLMASHMLGLALGRAVKVESLPTAKFTGQARPGDELTCLALPLPPKDGLEYWDVRVTSAEPGDGQLEKNVSAFRLACRA